MPEPEWIGWARELLAVARTGQHYASSPRFGGTAFDADRYRAVERIARQMLEAGFGVAGAAIDHAIGIDHGHITPKVDVRGALFDGDRVLLVRERLDDMRWTLPGGWADVVDTPAEAVEREFREETGLEVSATRLLALFDRTRHNQPPMVHRAYKAMFACEQTGGAMATSTLETAHPTFWPVNDLPELSTWRVTANQIRLLHRVYSDPSRPALFD